jgi:phosphoglycolate phosphatase
VLFGAGVDLQLVLWDIDGTLLQTEGAGRDAMGAAGEDLQGRAFAMEHIRTSGRLDTDIWRDLARVHGLRDSERLEARFRTAYFGRLKQRLDDGPARCLPGVLELVTALAGRRGFAQGLLTGNYPETGQLKLASAGLDLERFPIQAWGSDAARRPDLVPVALARAERLLGVRLPAGAVVVIGDTPRDIACAAEHGCRSLAVATGNYGLEALGGATRAVRDLSAVPEILAWLESPSLSVR